MGGTFDPIHIGHLVAADEARCQFQLDKVVFVPSARPPHKTGVRHSPAADRLQMVRIAIRGNPFLDVSDVELKREGLSYTIDTLRHLREVHGAALELFFITGADAILEILTWKDPDELLEESGRLADRLRISRAEYIRVAIRRMNRRTAARLRAERLAEVSKRVREESMRVNAEFAAMERDPDA